MLGVLLVCAATVGCGAPRPGDPRAAEGAEVADRPAAALLADYPPSPALRATLEAHGEGGSGRPRDHLLMTTWFTAPDARVGMWSTVDTAGHLTTYRFVHDWAVQDTQRADLTEIQLADVRTAIAQLPRPRSHQPLPIDRLLLVSFRQDGQWITRPYDRGKPPDVIVKLFETTGAPLAPEVPQQAQ